MPVYTYGGESSSRENNDEWCVLYCACCIVPWRSFEKRDANRTKTWRLSLIKASSRFLCYMWTYIFNQLRNGLRSALAISRVCQFVRIHCFDHRMPRPCKLVVAVRYCRVTFSCHHLSEYGRSPEQSCLNMAAIWTVHMSRHGQNLLDAWFRHPHPEKILVCMKLCPEKLDMKMKTQACLERKVARYEDDVSRQHNMAMAGLHHGHLSNFTGTFDR